MTDDERIKQIKERWTEFVETAAVSELAYLVQCGLREDIPWLLEQLEKAKRWEKLYEIQTRHTEEAEVQTRIRDRALELACDALSPSSGWSVNFALEEAKQNMQKEGG